MTMRVMEREAGEKLFSDLVIGYLFLGGTGAGACALLSLMGLLVPRDCVVLGGSDGERCQDSSPLSIPDTYRHLFSPAFCVAGVLLVVGSLMLVFDLGVSDRSILLVLFPMPTFITLGVFSLGVLIVVSLVLAVLWGQVLSERGSHRLLVVMHWAALVSSIVVMLYTGLLLSSMPAVPFWSTPWVPALFVVSALSCGCGMLLLCAIATGSYELFLGVMGRISRMDMLFVVVEAGVLVALLVSAYGNAYDVAGKAVVELIMGSYALEFWAGVVMVGILVPLATEALVLVLRRVHVCALVVIAVGVLVGGLLLRYCIVMLGAHPEVWTVIG